MCHLAPAAFAISTHCGWELLVKMPACLALGHHRAVRSCLAKPLAFRWVSLCQPYRASVTPGLGCYHKQGF